ncbi:hypothetical protein HOC37_04720, partial [bacterium]|nr:hypothetical protein [bacterium]
IFTNKKNLLEIIEMLLALLLEIRHNLSQNLLGHALNLEAVYHLYTLLIKSKDTLVNFEIKVKPEVFWHLFQEMMASYTIPFSGEPLAGLQIMGFLETRALDFENIFILSVNEGLLPQGKTSKSFIPYELRKINGLPTSQEYDALYAYNFYRLLKRAKNITLLYSTQSEDWQSQEKSRFIEQILVEFGAKNKNAKISTEKLALQMQKIKPATISITKTEAILEKIQKKEFSPSSLARYMNCALLFYFQDILGLAQDAELAESADALALGNIVHGTLKELYLPYKNQMIEDKDLQLLQKQAPKIIENAYRAELKNKEKDFLAYGKNKIKIMLLELLITKFLKTDGTKPFRLKELEQTYRTTLSIKVKNQDFKVDLKGTIDRVDESEKDGTRYTRIIDYKTGRIAALALTDLNDFKNEQSRFPKEAFQLLCYHYLHTSQALGGVNYLLGIYDFKNINRGLLYLSINKNSTLPPKPGLEFEKMLKNILVEIFNPELAFTQTTNNKNCAHCIYNDLCEKKEL